jgi:arsenite/tail-anchored protein-transporting ATPase
VAEARRTFTYLALFGYHVDAVIVNRLLPVEVVDPWFKGWKELQAEQLEAIEAGFAPVPVLTAELTSEELVGADRLDAFAETVYGLRSPAERWSHTEPFRVDADGAALVLSMHLPNISKHEVELGRRDGELLVAVGPHRRAVVLPDSLRRREVGGARLEDDRLLVEFVEAV